jgi:hypothetical protein
MEIPPRKSLAQLAQLTSVSASLPQNATKLQRLCFTNSTMRSKTEFLNLYLQVMYAEEINPTIILFSN